MMDTIADDILQQLVEDWYPEVNDDNQEQEEEARDHSIWHNEAPIF